MGNFGLNLESVLDGIFLNIQFQKSEKFHFRNQIKGHEFLHFLNCKIMVNFHLTDLC